MSSNIEISLAKTKIIGFFVSTIVFIALGILFICNPETFTSPIMRSPGIIKASGIVCVVFFGLCLFFITRKLFDNKPGLIIDQYGITINTNAINVGLVEWRDITGIEKKHVMSNKFLILHTNYPEKYIDRAKNVIAKQTMTLNNKTYGSPISIISNSLNLDFEDLEKLIRVEFERSKSKLN